MTARPLPAPDLQDHPFHCAVQLDTCLSLVMHQLALCPLHTPGYSPCSP